MSTFYLIVLAAILSGSSFLCGANVLHQDFVLRYLQYSNTNRLVMFSSLLDPQRFCRPPPSPQLNAHVLDNLKGFIINKIQPVDFLYICKWDTAVPVYVLKKATMSNCPPECILAALPSSSSPVDPEAKDCHCLELKGCGGVKTQLSPQHECHSHVLLLQALLF